MLRATLALALILTLSACDSTTDPAGQLDPLSQSLLRATTDVPGFAGVELETGEAIQTLGPIVLVYTLGDVAAARTAAASIFRGQGYQIQIQSRPAQGRGSEALKDQAAAALFGGENGAQSADFDETTGYVRVAVRDAAGVRQAYRVLQASDLPQSEIIIQVELPFRSL